MSVLLACGSNAKGQLGVGSIDDQHTFTPCLFSTSSPSPEAAKSSTASTYLNSRCPGHVLSAAFGANHSLLLTRDELGETTVWCSGDGARGQFGPKKVPRKSTPTLRFERLEPPDVLRKDGVKHEAVHVAASWETSYVAYRATNALSADSGSSIPSDVLFAYGANDFGNLGQAVPVDPSTLPPSRSRRSVTTAKEPSQRNAPPPPTPSSPFYNEASFASALRATGIFSSLPPTSQHPPFRIQDIAAGLQHVICVLRVFESSSTRDIIVGWGASRNGQLALREYEVEADQTGSTPSIPTSASASTSITPSTSTSTSRKSNGYPSFLTTPTHLYTVPANEQVISLACGQHHSVVLLRSTSSAGIEARECRTRLLVGGSNRKGQLDFSRVGRDKLDGVERVGCTWNATFLQLRTGTEKPLERGSGEIQASELIGVGRGEKGQLGVSPQAAGGSTVSSFSPRPVEFPFALILSSPLPPPPSPLDHDVKPANASTNQLDTRSPESFACGSEHVLALVSSPSQYPPSAIPSDPSHSINPDESKTEAWGWGWNEHGNLGLGHTEDVTVPVRLWPAASSSTIGDEERMGKAFGGRIRGAWAGNGTSWLYVDD